MSNRELIDSMNTAADRAVEALRAVTPLTFRGRPDPEAAHVESDEILLALLRELGCQRVVDAYHSVEESCDGFWYA